MNQKVINGLIAVATLSAVAVFVIYGVSSLTNATGRFPHTNALGVAGQFEAARNLPIAFMLLVAMILRDRRMLGVLLLTVGLIEFGDTFIGVAQQQAGQIISPLISGLIYVAASWYLLAKSSDR